MLITALPFCFGANIINDFEVSYLLDGKSELTLTEVNESNFVLKNDKNLNFGFYKGTIWVKIVPRQLDKNSVLEIKNSNIDHISFYTINKGKYQ